MENLDFFFNFRIGGQAATVDYAQLTACLALGISVIRNAIFSHHACGLLCNQLPEIMLSISHLFCYLSAIFGIKCTLTISNVLMVKFSIVDLPWFFRLLHLPWMQEVTLESVLVLARYQVVGTHDRSIQKSL